jgi:hypothetical protein
MMREVDKREGLPLRRSGKSVARDLLTPKGGSESSGSPVGHQRHRGEADVTGEAEDLPAVLAAVMVVLIHVVMGEPNGKQRKLPRTARRNLRNQTVGRLPAAETEAGPVLILAIRIAHETDGVRMGVLRMSGVTVRRAETTRVPGPLC